MDVEKRCKPLVVEHVFCYEVTLPYGVLHKYYEKTGMINLNRDFSLQDYHKIIELYTKENLPSLISEFDMEIDDVVAPFGVRVKDGAADEVGTVIVSDIDSVTIKVVVTFKMLMNIEIMCGFNEEVYYRCSTVHAKQRPDEYSNIGHLFEGLSNLFKTTIDDTISGSIGLIKLKPLERIKINSEPIIRQNYTAEAA